MGLFIVAVTVAHSPVLF